MDTPLETPLPIQEWVLEMDAAMDRIGRLGESMLAAHMKISEEAAKAAEKWKLKDRLAEEERMLSRFLNDARLILESIESCRQVLADEATDGMLRRAYRQCAETIEQRLPKIEESFVICRHCALDLLRWARQDAYDPESTLPDDYRDSYAALVAYAPVFKIRLEGFHQTLLARDTDAGGVHEDTQRLLSVLTRYNAVTESARAFVRSVVEPPLDLVFHVTNTFHHDWDTILSDDQSFLATEFNDCCQLLLYDRSEFGRRVQTAPPKLVEGIDASLYVMPIDAWRVIFLVDEDPVFHELRVTVMRVIQQDQYDSAWQSVVSDLYRDFLEGE